MTVTVLGPPGHGRPIPGCGRKLSATRFPPCHHTCTRAGAHSCAHVCTYPQAYMHVRAHTGSRMYVRGRAHPSSEWLIIAVKDSTSQRGGQAIPLHSSEDLTAPREQTHSRTGPLPSPDPRL